MNFNELIQKISFTTFAEVIAVSPRKVRESLFAHYGVKNKTRAILTSVKEKKEQRVRHVYDILQNANKPKEQEFIKELFRNWLFHKRELLKSTLDFLGVENDNGLVEVETDFFKELDENKVKKLVEHLKTDFPRDEIYIYLSFMEVPHLATHF